MKASQSNLRTLNDTKGISWWCLQSWKVLCGFSLCKRKTRVVTQQIPRRRPSSGFHWVLADRLMMDLKVQQAPGHTWALWAWGWGLPHSLHRLSKQQRQKITSEAVWDQEKKKINTIDGNPEHAVTLMFCKLDFFTFLPQPNSDKASQLFQMFWFLSAEPIPAEYGPVKTFPRRFHVESGLCCTAVKARQEEEICCKSATSWQLSGCKPFYSKAPKVILLFKWPCKNRFAFNSEKPMIYHWGIQVCPGIGDNACLF